MRKMLFAFLSVILLPALLAAEPVSGVFNSTDLGGQFLTGRYSNWRPKSTQGTPRVLHMQSWDGAALGTQWDITCPLSATDFATVDNRVGGVGTVVYTLNMSGGTFTLAAGGWPWGDGLGTLGVTVFRTTETYALVSGTATLISTVNSGNTYGSFVNDCALELSWTGGIQVNETPYATKPTTYPSFIGSTCAAATALYGEWGGITAMTLLIDCPIATDESTWGAIKQLYR